MFGRPWSGIRQTVVLAIGAWSMAARPVAAQAASTPPHGVIATRYGSATSSLLFVGYTVGPVMPMVALVQDPHSDYREELAGVLRSQPLTGHLAVTYGVAAARTTDAWYGQLWLNPRATVGRMHGDVRLRLYFPFASAGLRELTMNPASVVVDLSPRVAAGAVAVWATAPGSPPEFGAGPRLTYHIPNGSLTLDGVLGVTEWESEWRVGFYTTY